MPGCREKVSTSRKAPTCCLVASGIASETNGYSSTTSRCFQSPGRWISTYCTVFLAIACQTDPSSIRGISFCQGRSQELGYSSRARLSSGQTTNANAEILPSSVRTFRPCIVHGKVRLRYAQHPGASNGGPCFIHRLNFMLLAPHGSPSVPEVGWRKSSATNDATEVTISTCLPTSCKACNVSFGIFEVRD